MEETWFNYFFGLTTIKGLFTPWTKKLSHIRGHFFMVILYGNTSMVQFFLNAFIKPFGP